MASDHSPAPDNGPGQSMPSQDPTEGELSLIDLLLVISSNIRLLVFGPLVVGLIALGLSFLITPTFTARTSIIPPQQQGTAAAALAQLGGLGALAGSVAGLRSPTEQYMSLLRSTTVVDRLIDRFGLRDWYGVDLRRDARSILADKTRITTGKDGLIAIEVDDKSPVRSADIAKAYVEELRTLLAQLALTEAQQRRLFFEKQLVKTKDRLADAESALASIGAGRGAIRASPQATVDAAARLRAQVTAQEVKLASMRAYLTDSAPEFQQAQTELAALRTQLSKDEASDPAGSSKDGYIQRYRDFKYQETLFDLFSRQYEVAKLDEAREGNLIQVVDVALPPEYKSRPKKALIAVLTTLATGFLLLIWVFFKHVITKNTTDTSNALKLSRIKAGFAQLFTFKSRP